MAIMSITVVFSKIKMFSFSYIFLLWGIPIIFINLLDVIFLIKSSLKTPKNVDTRISSIIISLGGAASLLLTSLFLNYPPLHIPGAVHLKAIASLLSLLTYPLLIWALLCLRSCLTVIPEAHKVVANGIYKYSRHPLYMCYNIWALTYIFIFQSIPIIIVVFIYYIFVFLRIKREEELLLKTFPEYQDYYDRTGLFGLKFKK